MVSYLYFLLIPFVYAENITIGGGGNQKCSANLNLSQRTEWHYPLFPIPVVIDSRIGKEKVKMYIHATVIWNKVYRSFLKKKFREPEKYPQKLFVYLIINNNFSEYKESPYIIWASEQSFEDNKVNGRTEYPDKWYWVSYTIKVAHIHLNINRLWYF